MIKHNTPQFSLKENYLIHLDKAPKTKTAPKKAEAIKSAHESTDNFKEDIKAKVDTINTLKKTFVKEKQKDRKLSKRINIAKKTQELLKKLAEFNEDGASPINAIANKDLLTKIIDGSNKVANLTGIPTIKISKTRKKEDIITVDDNDILSKKDANDLSGHSKSIVMIFKGEKIITTTKEKYETWRPMFNMSDKLKGNIDSTKLDRDELIKLKKAKKPDLGQIETTRSELETLTTETLEGLLKFLGNAKKEPVQRIDDQWEKSLADAKKKSEAIKAKDMPIITRRTRKRTAKAKTAEEGAEICLTPEDELLNSSGGTPRSYYVTTFKIEYKGDILKGTYVHHYKYLTYKTDNTKSDRSTNKAIAKSKEAIKTKANAAKTAGVLGDENNEDLIIAKAAEIKQKRAVAAAAKAKKAADEKAAAVAKKAADEAAAAKAAKAKKAAAVAAAVRIKKEDAETNAPTAKVATNMTPEKKTGK